MQRHYTVAACRVGQRVSSGVVAFRVGVAVNPCVGIAFRHLIHTSIGVIDGEVQCHHTVATCRIGQRMGRSGGAFGIGVAVNPCIGIAFCHLIHTGVGVVDGQVQRHHAVATCRIGQCMGWCVGALSVGVAVHPLVAFAGHLLVDAVGSRSHSKCHGHHRVASVGSGQHSILCTCRVEHHFIPCVGQFTFTDRSCNCGGGNVAFFNHKVIHVVRAVERALTSQNKIGGAVLSDRQVVGVPSFCIFGGNHRIAHLIVVRDESQLGGTFNITICAGKDTDTFILVC